MVPTLSQPTPPHQIRQLQERGIPVVFCHRRVEGISAPLLAIPSREVGRMAGKLVLEHGHQHIAFVTSPFGQQTNQSLMYQEGFREIMPADVSVETQFVEAQPRDLREESCWKALQELFAKPEPPTCIYATFDSMSQTIFFLLQRMGLRVPEDVSLVSFGGAWREDAFSQRLTAVVVDEVATGQKAVSLLDEMRRGDRDIDNDEKFILSLDVHQGKTLAAPATRVHGNYDHKNYDNN